MDGRSGLKSARRFNPDIIVLCREQILENVGGYNYYGEIRVVDVHLGHTRQKLGSEDVFATVRGVGYRFEDESL
jgi:two-component system alkaline phosphatase synthesis response regulator PhoP